MRNVLKSALLAAALAIAPSVQAATVFESFPNYASAGATNLIACSSCGGAGAVIASFTLTANETLDKAFLLAAATDANNALASWTVSIFNDGGNDLPALNGQQNGMLPPILYQTFTGPSSVDLAPVQNPGSGYNNYIVELGLPNWQLNAGKYWVRFAGYSTLLPIYQTATPLHSRVVGNDFLLDGRFPVAFAGPNGAIGFSLNGINPNGAVPEPATWAMMIAGFGVIGTAMRRRRRVAVSFC
jgi:PEP-CTERM motif